MRNDAGRVLFLQKKYAEAIKEFEQVLTIDPEDVQAHYNLMLCYNGLGKEDRALEHQKRYLRFKADESAQSITGPYRPLILKTTTNASRFTSIVLAAAQARRAPDAATLFARPRTRCRQTPGAGVSFDAWWSAICSADFGVIQYVDVTKAAGLTFRHNSGASGKKYLPETLGPGVAFIDYNGDGWQDLFFTNGKDWPGQRRRPSTLELFRNNKNGTFTNVTAASGLNREVYGMGSPSVISITTAMTICS